MYSHQHLPTQYYLKTLEKTDLIKSRRIGAFRRYYTVWGKFLIGFIEKNGNMFCQQTQDYLAFSLVSHMAKGLFSVSRQSAKYPIPGTACLGAITLPPASSTFDLYSSTELMLI